MTRPLRVAQFGQDRALSRNGSRVPSLRRQRGEAGDSAIELAILATAIVFIIGLVVAFGRTQQAQGQVSAAAGDAARAASLRQLPTDATTDADNTANASLAGDNVTCRGGPQVTVDTSEFHSGGQVTVDITCTASLAAIALPGIPGSSTLHGHAIAVIDPTRSGH